MTLEDPLIDLEAPSLPSSDQGQNNNTNYSKQKASELKPMIRFCPIAYHSTKKLYPMMMIRMIWSIMISATSINIASMTVILFASFLLWGVFPEYELRIDIDGNNDSFYILNLGTIINYALIGLGYLFLAVTSLVFAVAFFVLNMVGDDIIMEKKLLEEEEEEEEEEKDTEFELVGSRLPCILAGYAGLCFMTTLMGWKICYYMATYDRRGNYYCFCFVISFVLANVFLVIFYKKYVKKLIDEKSYN